MEIGKECKVLSGKILKDRRSKVKRMEVKKNLWLENNRRKCEKNQESMKARNECVKKYLKK